VPLQPAGEQHHYVVLLVPLLLLVPLAGRLAREAPAAAALAALAVGLLLLPSYFLDNAAWAGWPRALLAYPRLYAALALWAGLVIWRGAGSAGLTPEFAVDDRRPTTDHSHPVARRSSVVGRLASPARQSLHPGAPTTNSGAHP
jgi:hypothetical protein